jgi:hypothetical protein
VQDYLESAVKFLLRPRQRGSLYWITGSGQYRLKWLTFSPALTKIGYDLYSAVTFLLIGLGLGTVFAMVFNPNTKQRVRLERINSRRAPGVQPQEEEKERVA